MKCFITSFILTCSICCLSQNTSISGTIENPFQETVYARYWDQATRKTIILDSAQIKNGVYMLSFDLDSAKLFDFYDGSEYSRVLMKPGEHLGLSLNTAYFDETIHYTGDGANRHRLMKSMYLIQESEMNWIFNEMERIVNNFGKKDTPDTTDFFANVDTMQMNYEAFMSEQLVKFPDVKDEITSIMESHFLRMDRLVSQMRRSILLRAMEVSSVGDDFYNIVGVNLDDKKAEIKDFYGKPMVIDFWATWCGPCKYQFPFLKEIEAEYEDEVTFLSVAVWCEKEGWVKMAKDYGFKNNIFLEDVESDKLKEKYLLNFIPRYVLLDANGKIININAERPTTGLKEQLDALLEKG